MNFQRGREKEHLEINLVPLIDVMMVILIFLMITTTYSKYTELQINLPSADAEKQLQRSNEVNVLVNAQGQYVVNRTPVAFISVEQLAYGISVALYNTAFGIGIAIPSLIFYRHFKNKVDGFVVQMEQAASKLIDIVHGEREGYQTRAQQS